MFSLFTPQRRQDLKGSLIFALKNNLHNLVKVQTRSGEILKIYFKRIGGKFENIWLEGSARMVYSGIYKLA